MITDAEARTYAEGLRGYLDRHFGGELDPIPDDALSMAADLVEFLTEAPTFPAREVTVAFRVRVPEGTTDDDVQALVTNAYVQFEDGVVQEPGGNERRVPTDSIHMDVGTGIAVMLPAEVWTRVREIVDYHLSKVDADDLASQASRAMTEHLVVDALR